MPCYDSLMVLVTAWQESEGREEEEDGFSDWKGKAEMNVHTDTHL